MSSLAFQRHGGRLAAASLARLAADATRLDRLLLAAGFEVVGGTALFRLAGIRHADRWFEGLCRAGVLARPFSEAPTWLRFGLPPASGWSRVEAALKLVMEDVR